MTNEITFAEFEQIINKYDRDHIDQLLEILGEDISALSYEQMLDYIYNSFLDKFDLSTQELILK